MRPLARTCPFDVKASSTGSSLSFLATASASFVPTAFTALRYCRVARVNARLDHVWHPPGALGAALAELAVPVVEVPIIALGQHQTLRGFQAQAMDLRHRQQRRREPLAAGDDAEFPGLLDRIDGVLAAAVKGDSLRLGALRMQEEGREVRGVEREEHVAKHLAPAGRDDLAGVLLPRVTGGIVQVMKNCRHRSSPARRPSRPRAHACDRPSGTRRACKAEPVSAGVDEATTISIFFFSAAICCTASATDDTVRSVIMSTPSTSYQRRAMAVATSGLFW